LVSFIKNTLLLISGTFGGNKMKKILLASSALVGVAMLAAPAQAELKLGLGGHFSGYGVYVDQDNDDDLNNFEFRKNTEIHFTGETTLDNGLTVGVHVEQEVENDNNNNESYAYFSGGWGRVNFGNEDGAAYLLQVAAPSADSNVDGLRATISGIRVPVQSDNGGVGLGLLQGATNALGDAGSGTTLDYQHADFGNGPTDSLQGNAVDRLSYLTPKFSGFQAGVSYAPEAALNSGIVAMGDDTTDFENLWELAARWDGQFEGVGLSFGAGYSHASDQDTGGDDLKTWNVGANLTWNQFSFGGSYLDSDNGNDNTTWVVGAAWDNGPWHVGASYLNGQADNAGLSTDAVALVSTAQTNDLEAERFTIGGGYAFGPGMTFRGALSWGSLDAGSVTNDLAGSTARISSDDDFTMVTIGTDIRF
jgi:outer membrane protein OmpU